MAYQNIDDRRDSFRVEMAAMISLKPAMADVIEASDCFPELHALALLSENDLVETEINLLSDRIKDLAVKKTIDLLRQQMSLIAKLIDVQTVQKNDLKNQTIDISEGGCSLTTTDSFDINDRVALALIFTPSYFTLFTIAYVTDITKQDDLQILHLGFEGLSELKTQKLVKYMFKAQTDLAKPK